MLVGPFKSVASEGLAELLLLATIATVYGRSLDLKDMPYARRLMFIAP